MVREDFWGNQVLQQLGDVIVSIDGKKMATTEDLQNALQDKKPGESVELKFSGRAAARESRCV